MLDVRLFANPAFSAALAVNLLSIFALVGFIYFISQHLQLVAGYTPMMAGVLMLPGLALTVGFGLLAVRADAALRGQARDGLGPGAQCRWPTASCMLTGQSGSVPMLMLAFSVLGAGVGLSETLSNDMALAAVPSAPGRRGLGDLRDRLRGRLGAGHRGARIDPQRRVPQQRAGTWPAGRRCRRDRQPDPGRCARGRSHPRRAGRRPAFGLRGRGLRQGRALSPRAIAMVLAISRSGTPRPVAPFDRFLRVAHGFRGTQGTCPRHHTPKAGFAPRARSAKGRETLARI